MSGMEAPFRNNMTTRHNRYTEGWKALQFGTLFLVARRTLTMDFRKLGQHVVNLVAG